MVVTVVVLIFAKANVMEALLATRLAAFLIRVLVVGFFVVEVVFFAVVVVVGFFVVVVVFFAVVVVVGFFVVVVDFFAVVVVADFFVVVGAFVVWWRWWQRRELTSALPVFL